MYKEILTKLKIQEMSKSESFSEDEVMEMLKNTVINKANSSDKDISEEELSKSVKNAFRTGLTVLGMIHGAHHMGQPAANEALTQDQKQAQTRSIASAREEAKNEGMAIYEKHKQSYKDKKINNFLKAIEMNESSGGINTNHKRMNSGIHSGDAAVGNYGLMPNTVKNIAGLMERGHPLRKKYLKMENSDIERSLSENPKHQKELATHLATKLHDKFGGDESRMAYSWNQGHNLTPDHFESSHKDYKNHDYVQKYHKNRGLIEKGPVKSQKTNDIASN